MQFLRTLKFLQEHQHNEIDVCKLNYYSQIKIKLNHIQKRSKAYYTTEKRLDTLNFSNNGAENIMQNLDSNKARGHDKIGIRMIKSYGKSICTPVEFILINAVTLVLFR